MKFRGQDSGGANWPPASGNAVSRGDDVVGCSATRCRLCRRGWWRRPVAPALV